MNHFKCSHVISRWDIYLRSHAAITTGRSGAIQSVTATIRVGTEWHGITTVDSLSIRLSLGSDGKYHSRWARGPSWGGDDRTCAGWPQAGICTAVQPILRVATRSVGRPQGDSVSTFNGGVSVNCQSQNSIMSSYFKSRVYSYDRVQRWWQTNLHWVYYFSHSIFISFLSAFTIIRIQLEST